MTIEQDLNIRKAQLEALYFLTESRNISDAVRKTMIMLNAKIYELQETLDERGDDYAKSI